MLYIVGTPIGNLDDLSYRQAKTLVGCDTILSEDTRSTGLLLNRIHTLFDPLFDDHHRTWRPKLISYYKDNEFDKLPFALSLIRDDKDVCLISQAGMPLVSDPGYLLVKSVIKEELPYTVIPGPTAATTALIHSGFKPDGSMYLGFLPKKTGDIKRLLEKCKQIKIIMPDAVFVMYESPHRIQDTLQIIESLMPDSPMIVARELTKKFEQVLRGIAKDLQAHEFIGELTIVIG
ncbi:hypothetical protein BH09PAT2_BH09PAT2_05490 [soil metagenome]